MPCPAPGGVENLLSARKPGGNDLRSRAGLSDDVEKARLSNLQRDVIVFGFIPKSSGHSTTGGVDRASFEPGWRIQDCQRRTDPPKGLLVTMTMDENVPLFIGEGDLHFTFRYEIVKKTLERPNVSGDLSCFFGIDEVHIVVG